MSLRLMSAIISVSPATASTTTFNYPEDSNKLLNLLLECVQQCQKRFGGKSELATEFDSCVAGLCLTLEAVFLHGLRNKPLNSESSTLKQVTNIVTNSLHLSSDNSSFWPFIKQHLTKHEQERYSILKHIWTDTGRGKAFIRSSLNERSLERYFHVALSNKEILNTYYEDWALLRDDDKNSMLPNMAAGLCSILFAISIDKPEHNSGLLAQKMDKIKTKAEPIIEAPIIVSKNDQKKKRKVAKQLISFDDEDSVLSSSVPSSCSSITSENSDSSCLNTTNREETKEPTPTSSNKQLTRKLSIETSGSRDKYPNLIEGTLTPVQSNIGELTPISIETNDSPNSSDLIEIPADISAVLTVVETKNKEEMDKLKEKLSEITTENECLKEQLKKYIDAVQMLNTNGDDSEECLKQLEVNKEIPDYKSEAKLYEKKLVQVAEMHAELMDFNVFLQHNLCKKDSLVERLKTELEELRGPINNIDLNDETRSCVNIWIPSAFLTGHGSDAHHVYQIFLRAGNDEWNIYRRYAQFHALHSDLKKLDPAVTAFDFPPKKSIGKKDSAIVEDRRKRLQKYVRRVLSHWPELSQCNSRFLLEQHLAFFKDQNDPKIRKERKSLFSPNRGTDNHYSGL